MAEKIFLSQLSVLPVQGADYKVIVTLQLIQILFYQMEKSSFQIRWNMSLSYHRKLTFMHVYDNI